MKARPSRREEICNAASAAATGEREQDVANAESPIDEVDGWFKASPYGVFPGRTPGRPQYVGEAQGRAIVEEFNSLRSRLGRLFKGLPIYRGHPDVDPTVWPDDRRLGKVTDLEARPDGLWAFAEWNTLGKENKAEEFWIYPSPRWDAPKGKARFEPDRLISIGLTNTPRISESDPVFNSLNPEHSETNMDRNALIKALGLKPEATDEEILAKITANASAAADAETRVTTANTEKTTAEQEAATAKGDKAAMENSLAAERTKVTELATKVGTLETKVSGLETSEKKLREDLANSILDGAVRAGKITQAERPAWLAKLTGEKREEEANSLKALKPRLNTTGINLDGRHNDKASADGLREQVANALDELKGKGMSHHDAWCKVKQRTEFSAYFAGAEG